MLERPGDRESGVGGATPLWLVAASCRWHPHWRAAGPRVGCEWDRDVRGGRCQARVQERTSPAGAPGTCLPALAGRAPAPKRYSLPCPSATNPLPNRHQSATDPPPRKGNPRGVREAQISALQPVRTPPGRLRISGRRSRRRRIDRKTATFPPPIRYSCPAFTRHLPDIRRPGTMMSTDTSAYRPAP